MAVGYVHFVCVNPLTHAHSNEPVIIMLYAKNQHVANIREYAWMNEWMNECIFKHFIKQPLNYKVIYFIEVASSCFVVVGG